LRSSIGFGTNGYGTAGEGDSSAIRVQADDVDYVTFKANASSYCFDLNEFYLRNNVAPAITVQAVNSSGATVGSAVTFSGLLANSYNLHRPVRQHRFPRHLRLQGDVRPGQDARPTSTPSASPTSRRRQ
jgi:hypothetical protein